MLSLIGLSAALVSAPISGIASEDFNAAHFVQSQCTRCHDSGVYTRQDRRVTSLKGLDSQVRMCDANLGTGLFDDDIAAVVGYLNQNYYKFNP
jgi:cytochrome c553